MGKLGRLVKRQRWFGGQFVEVPQAAPVIDKQSTSEGCVDRRDARRRRLVQLNFSVPEEFKQAMKLAAVRDDKKLVQVLQEAFALYEGKHGKSQ